MAKCKECKKVVAVINDYCQNCFLKISFKQLSDRLTEVKDQVGEIKTTLDNLIKANASTE